MEGYNDGNNGNHNQQEDHHMNTDENEQIDQNF